MTERRQEAAGSQVDDLRQRLRQLGYLDAGIDRFVLGSAQQGQSAASVGLLASLRIGVLGALFLGPAAALGITARLPGLANGVRDVFVLAVYTAIFFGVVISGVALVASLAAARIARRAGPSLARRSRPLAVAAGTGVGLLSVIYLAMLWTMVTSVWGGGGAHGTLWLLAGLVVAAAISLLLGHAVTLTALAVLVAGTESPVAVGGVPGTSWKGLLGLGALAVGGALCVFVLMPPAPDAPPPPPLAVVPSGYRMRVVAVDGFDPRVFQRLAAAGRVPALAAALGSGAASLRFEAPASAGATYDPARLWTSVATGQPASVHGVEALETRRVAGVSGSLGGPPDATWSGLRTAMDLIRLTRPAIASGSERRAKTFWEVAAGAGLRTAVVNWWATWPAAEDAGVVLSDRATLRLERGGALDAEIAPADLYDTLQARWPALRATATALVDSVAGGADVAASGAAGALLLRSAQLDAVTRVLSDAVATPGTDLLVSYYPGLDIVQHGAAAAAAGDVERYYGMLDRLLTPVLAAGPQEVVVLVTAPGRVEAGNLGRLAVLGTAGAGAAAATTLEGRDVAPTLLYALGLPISRELPGTVATSLLAPDFVARYPVRFVSEYGRPGAPAPHRGGQPLEQEMIDRLRSLGYVK
jgi:Type I phosphodiesterase / nucleotide pyrophosphatase